VRDVNELKQHLVETWSATSRASLIKRLISGEIVFKRVSKPRANTEHLFLHKAPFTHRALPRVAVEALPRGNARCRAATRVATRQRAPTRVKLHANDMQVYVHKMAEAVIDVVVAAAAFFEIFDSDEEEEKEQRRRRTRRRQRRFWVHDVNRRREVWPFCFITWRSENTVSALTQSQRICRQARSQDLVSRGANRSSGGGVRSRPSPLL